MATTDLNDGAHQLDILNRFSIDLVDVTDKQTLFWLVAREVVSKLGFVDCVIYEFEEKSQLLVQRAAFGIKNPFADEIVNLLEIPLGKGVTGNVAETASPEIVSDASQDKRYIHDVGDNLSEITVPIIYDGKVHGVIDCEDPRKDYFNSEHLRALTTVAAMLASKLLQYDINAKLQETNRALNKEIDHSRAAEKALQQHKDSLESTVAKRTFDLQQSIDELISETQKKLKAEEELRLNQEILFQSAKMASIGVLAAGVAHEINNPVAFVKSNLQTLEEYIEDLNLLLATQSKLVTVALDEKGEINQLAKECSNIEKSIDLAAVQKDLTEMIKAALDGTSRIIKIVTELREFSHEDSDILEEHDINQLIDKALSIALNEIKYKVKISLDYGEIPMISCWGDKLVQVFLNILVNAAQAIEEQGEINISTNVSDGKLVIVFSDTGTGMSEAVKDRIFDPFYTTKDVGVGTGLGLHISYNIIDNHGGSIKVDSEVGKGTNMIICLPVTTTKRATKLNSTING